MIPSTIDPATKSPGEKELFKRFADDPGTEGWTVLHSFNLPRHVARVQGEADFVVLAPGLGLLVLEVKAHHRVARWDDGRWKLGNEPPKSRSPFQQADEALRSVYGEVERRNKGLTDATVAWSAVAFTHTPFDVPAGEWNDWEVIDTHALRRRPLSALVAGVLTQARKKLPAKAVPGTPTEEECDAIAALLRPRFEVFQPLSHRREEADQELLAFTEEQYLALDGMAHADRVVFRGPAGTGKTVLAVEEARRASAAGHRVLLLCFNRLLGDALVATTKDIKNVTSATLHALMLKIAQEKVPPGAGDQFWQDVLPEAAVTHLLNGDQATFDLILMDEAQDLLRDSYLDVLDLLLEGGLAAGRWRMFGDFERQALFDAADVPLDTFLSSRAAAQTFDFRTNCRNTPKVARWVSHVAALDPAYVRIRRPDVGPPPRTRYFDDPGEQQALLVKLLADLYGEGFEGQDIAVLSFKRNGVAAQVTTAPWRDRLKPCGSVAGSGFIQYATVQAFKGLEAAVVVLTDVDEVQGDRARSLFYTAVTRPTERLYVLAEGHLRDEFVDLIERFSAQAEEVDR
jgi:hypothetical protein